MRGAAAARLARLTAAVGAAVALPAAIHNSLLLFTPHIETHPQLWRFLHAAEDIERRLPAAAAAPAGGGGGAVWVLSSDSLRVVDWFRAAAAAPPYTGPDGGEEDGDGGGGGGEGGGGRDVLWFNSSEVLNAPARRPAGCLQQPAAAWARGVGWSSAGVGRGLPLGRGGGGVGCVWGAAWGGG
jgi:hypothetical protein